MRSNFVLIAILSGAGFPAAAQTKVLTQAEMDSLDAVRIPFISQYRELAVGEMERTGIPASITLAQAILESGAGSSRLAREANNHFGIKCGPHWMGPTIYKHDDERDRDGQPMLSCFRVYANPAEGYADHSDFLVDPQKYNRYQVLFGLPYNDYLAWARGLQQAGYSSASHYSARLVEYIERYRLYELDRPPSESDPRRRICRVNELQMVLAHAGETLSRIAQTYGLPVNDLVAYNDYNFAPDEPLPPGARIWLELKSAEWLDENTHHWVQGRQTMAEIAQAYGIRIDDLLRRNGMQPGQEPVPGTKVRLNGRREPGEFVKIRGKRFRYLPEPASETAMAPLRQLPTMNAANSRQLTRVLGPTGRIDPGAGLWFAVQPPEESVPHPPMVSRNVKPVPHAAVPEEPVFHVVSPGDTLMAIARKYGVKVSAIKQSNQLQGDTVRVGQMLRVK
jgi:LysM repeat protein